jgi:hypothetical protein
MMKGSRHGAELSLYSEIAAVMQVGRRVPPLEGACCADTKIRSLREDLLFRDAYSKVAKDGVKAAAGATVGART